MTVHFLFINCHTLINVCTDDKDSDSVTDAPVAEMLLEKKTTRQETYYKGTQSNKE